MPHRLLLASLLLLTACPGSGDQDSDADGYTATRDCDDEDPAVHPGAEETCNERDDDCDGQTDEAVTTLFFSDADGDGYGAATSSVSGCTPPPGYAANADDCDDQDLAVHPAAEETCNGLDDDCDGDADDGAIGTWYSDVDGDGYGDPATAEETCMPAAGSVTDGTDCDDANADVHPGQDETCDGDDDDCDGRPDLVDVATWHEDADGDGYGHPAITETTCAPEEGWVLDGTDCNPSDPAVHPGAEELCNGVDDDCDRLLDEVFDADADGFEAAGCRDGTDCDDTDAAVHPGGTDACGDGVDQDCDGHDRVCGLDGDYNLADADALLWCPTPTSDAGRLVEVGDADGDGLGDLLVATYYADGANGGAWVAYGPFTADSSLADVGYRLRGSRDTYNAGRGIGMADTDGDGLDDLLLGAPHSTDGSAYLFYGPVTADQDVDASDVRLRGPVNTEFGHGADLADINADGIADAIIGAYEDLSVAGAIYVQYGPFDAEEDVASGYDAWLQGVTRGDQTGNAMKAGRDFNGDGIGDILAPAITSKSGGPASGCAYVIYGPVSGTSSLSDADGILAGEVANDQAGQALTQGDLDGDGLADAAVSSLGMAAASGGSVFVVLGPATGDVSLATAPAIIRGTSRGQMLGSGLGAGDVDADGIDDLIVGAAGDPTTGSAAGAAFFYQGPFSGTLAPSDAQAALYGETGGDAAGQGIGVGPLDGDTFADLVIGAPSDATGGSGAGAVFLFRPAY